MQPPPTRQTRTFIVRIWREYLDEKPPTWRGEVEDTRNQETTRFSSLEQMNAIVHAWSVAKPGDHQLTETPVQPGAQPTQIRRDGQ